MEFYASWSPGDSDEKLKEVLEACIKYGKEERSMFSKAVSYFDTDFIYSNLEEIYLK